MYQKHIKRWLDLIFSVVLLLALLPLGIILALMLCLEHKGSPFFFQHRPGRHEQIFSICKFKTMKEAYDPNGKLLPDHLRTTKMGAFLRKTSLDELPQLWNVAKGDLSFIGPRPLLVRYLPYYSREEKIRHRVRPGITGLAQISGRNLLNWDDRLSYDITYVENISLKNDILIFLRTIKKVAKSEGVVVSPGALLIDLDEYRK
jgi:undecaprenyl phosphate N,N'-diacetylbacillosamine 1-phosphate transferase